jgi:hypothetical protein
MSMKVHPSECPYGGQQPADCMCNFDPPRYLRMIPPNTNLRKKDLQLRILISGTSQPPVAALIRALGGALGRVGEGSKDEEPHPFCWNQRFLCSV